MTGRWSPGVLATGALLSGSLEHLQFTWISSNQVSRPLHRQPGRIIRHWTQTLSGRIFYSSACCEDPGLWGTLPRPHNVRWPDPAPVWPRADNTCSVTSDKQHGPALIWVIWVWSLGQYLCSPWAVTLPVWSLVTLIRHVTAENVLIRLRLRASLMTFERKWTQRTDGEAAN